MLLIKNPDNRQWFLTRIVTCRGGYIFHDGYCYISLSYTALRLRDLSLSYCGRACSYSSLFSRLSLGYCSYCYIAAHIYIESHGSMAQKAVQLPICAKNLLRYERFHISYLPYVASYHAHSITVGQ